MPGARCALSNVLMALGGLALATGLKAQNPPTRFVAAEDAQPQGPAHDFRLGAREITNAEFVIFLNDALAHLEDPRGEHMYFDIDSGDVYIAPTRNGQVGTSGSGTLLLDVSVNLDRIVYDSVIQVYRLGSADLAEHPVTGVTWFGAVKYCNWLTLARGLPVEERAYIESTAAAEWRPATISLADWIARDLNAAERDALLQLFGYRLPMDGGAGGSSPGTYNEWYKAAAWDEALGINHVYGFGRDTLSGADANFRDSGDPFDNGTTPVGYYDGSDHGGTFQTRADDNAYGLADASGNVWEWMQDQDVSPTQRRNRGGGHASARSALETARAAARSADVASGSTGVRIAQSVPVPLFAAPRADLVNAGVWGGPYDDTQTSTTYEIFNFSGGRADFTAASDQDWVTVEPESGTIDEEASSPVQVRLAPHCTDGLIVGENLALVTIQHVQDGSTLDRYVRLTVREPLAVAPTDEFATSTTAGRLPATRDRSYVISSASDLPVDWSAQWLNTGEDAGAIAWLTLNGADTVSGTIDPHGQQDLVLAISDAAADLPPGLYAAEVVITDECTGSTMTLAVQLGVGEPLDVDPEGDSVSSGRQGGPFTPDEHVFTLTNLVDGACDWTAAIEPPTTNWLELDSRSGSFNAFGESAGVQARLTSEAEQLSSGTYEADLVFTDVLSGSALTRRVVLNIGGLQVDPPEGFESTGREGGPFWPGSTAYTLHNPGIEELYWTAEFEDTSDPPCGVAWIEVEPADGVILDEDGSAEITIRISEQAEGLAAGSYTGVVTFSAESFRPVQRTLTLVVTRSSMTVEPDTPWTASGRPGGPIHWRSRVFALHNPDEGRGPIDWRVTLQDPSIDWLLIDSDRVAQGRLEDGGRTTVVVSIDAAATLDLPLGEALGAVIVFEDLTSGEPVERSLTLTLVQPILSPVETLIDPSPKQFNGPTHAYVLGRTHVTNAEFATFLNDALAHKDNERGAFLYHDVDSGDLFIHSEAAGTEGTEGAGTPIYRRSSGSVQIGRIRFDGGYVVEPGFEAHPVTGVSWFGALKFCNWLSLDQGLPAAQRCYAEAPSTHLDGWHPATISDADWSARDLTDDEQQRWVTGFLGFRLPMDDGADRACANAGTDDARSFNEWFAAAAWNPQRQLNARYGFGRDTIDGLDANYKGSGDPYEGNLIPTTPVALYDGTDHGDGFLGRADANAFGLFDMSGNVHQWLSNRYCTTRLNSRTLRGGAHDSARSGDDVPALRTVSRAYASPSFVGAQVGFRCVRSTAHPAGDADGDGDVDDRDWLALTACMGGPGQPSGFDCAALDLDADGDVDLADAAALCAVFEL